eukprot:gb/GEZN01015950.1/.p1 GENE.gb/GEZN01015950.1/~~gb/GEZN01015950.1/.p1  ORF type:complete len:236 (-),score=13.77 gb/GEZN01015950.1/:137-844(-)
MAGNYPGQLTPSCLDSCCYDVEIGELEKVDQYLIQRSATVGERPQSCTEFFCLCNAKKPVPRPVKVPPKLQGIFYQGGAQGSKYAMTFNFGAWDEKKRVLWQPVQDPSVWTQWDTCSSKPSVYVSRLARCSYLFTFSEDMRFASIVWYMNPCVCIPCLPAWCWMCSCCVRFEMTEVKESTDGQKWDRNSTLCCCVKGRYDLVKIVDPEGKRTEFWSVLESDIKSLKAPARATMQI